MPDSGVRFPSACDEESHFGAVGEMSVSQPIMRNVAALVHAACDTPCPMDQLYVSGTVKAVRYTRFNPPVSAEATHLSRLIRRGIDL